jgi:hypothetical protein
MSSATLTDAKARLKAPSKPVAETGVNRTDDGFHAWHFFVLVSILLATVAVFMTRRSTPENLILLSFTIAAAGLTAGALYRMLLPLTSPDLSTLDQPMTDRRRATLERDKALTLRSIKELEFDRAMGKLSQNDFDEMAGRLRQRAVTIMKQLDEGRSYTSIIEQDLKARLGSSAVLASVPVAARAACACGTINDEDAVFCKKCGARVHA